MRAGSLRHYIDIQQKATQASDGMSAAGKAWSTAPVLSAWADIKPLRGEKLALFAQAQGEVTHEISLRFSTIVTVDMRVRYRSRVFSINSVINVNERNRELLLMCKEGM